MDEGDILAGTMVAWWDLIGVGVLDFLVSRGWPSV